MSPICKYALNCDLRYKAKISLAYFYAYTASYTIIYLLLFPETVVCYIVSIHNSTIRAYGFLQVTLGMVFALGELGSFPGARGIVHEDLSTQYTENNNCITHLTFFGEKKYVPLDP